MAKTPFTIEQHEQLARELGDLRKQAHDIKDRLLKNYYRDGYEVRAAWDLIHAISLLQHAMGLTFRNEKPSGYSADEAYTFYYARWTGVIDEATLRKVA